jgi:hypothetical protein
VLRKGQSFTLNGLRYRVQAVSPCRAHCVATVKTPVTVTNRKSGTSITFVRTSTKTIDISPDTPLDVLADLENGRLR